MKGSVDTGRPTDSLHKHPPPLQQRAASECAHRSRRLWPAQTALFAPAQRNNARTKRSGTLNAATVRLESHGCPKNLVDGEVLLGDLGHHGYNIMQESEEVDCVIVNTCAFVEEAKAESLQAIMEAAELKKDGRVKKVVVTGCLAQRYADELAESLPEADFVVGFQNYAGLPATLQSALGTDLHPASTVEQDYQRHQRVQVGEATIPFRSEVKRHRLTAPHTAYLRVAEGCNHACTFCAIPGFRGKFRSKGWHGILDEARQLVESGVKELNLIAEDTNQYGMDRRDGKGLAELMAELGKLEGLRWMRILYAYPSYFSEELINEIARNPKVCKYIDIPLQHMSNLVLLGMNRPARTHTVDLLEKLKSRIPGLALRTTFISGFPGETEEQHRELVAFCKKFKFERMGAFAYSEEDGTPAAEMPDQVPVETRQARRDELISQQQLIGQRFAESLIGKRALVQVDVLVEGYDHDDNLIGRTQWDAPDVDPIVFLNQDAQNQLPPLIAGQMRRCLVTGASLTDLEATPIA